MSKRRIDHEEKERSQIRKTNTENITGCGNLQEHILRLHGEEVFRHTKKFSQLRIKRSTLLADLTYLMRCRDHNITPKFLRLKHHTNTKQVNNILRRTSTALLRATIHDTRAKLDSVNKELYNIHLFITQQRLHSIIFDTLDKISYEQAEHMAQIKKNRHIKKFQSLAQQQEPQKIDPDTVIHNRTHLSLDDNTKSALAKGFNFAITPSKIPIEKIISRVEASISDIHERESNQIRLEVTRILQNAKPPKCNLPRGELQALRTLQQNPDIYILPADKGNSTVIMYTQEYHTKMKNILDTPDYKTTPNNPTTYTEKKTKTLLQQTSLPDEIKRKISPREKSSRIPRIYGLPKIHKPDCPLRPIVSAYDSPTHPLAQHLAQQLQPLAENTASYIKNSRHFLDRLASVAIHNTDILVSFDVSSLFTNIPIAETLNILREQHNTPEDIIRLTQHCMASTYFIYEDHFYKQTRGAPMGSPLSPVIANIFMAHFEEKALATHTLKPTCWFRYVDDIFVIWPHGNSSLQEFHNHINNIHTSIQFTIETEQNNTLPFLDTLITKNNSGGFHHTVYRKPTHTNRYLHASSHHHPAQLKSILNTLTHRSVLLTDSHNINRELTTLQQALQKNGYSTRQINIALSQKKQTPDEENDTAKRITLPYIKGTTDRISKLLRKHNIRTAFNTHRKTGNMLRTPKQKIPNETTGVYEIPCNDCNRTYVGQSNRRIQERTKEHIRSVKRGDNTSALSQHYNVTGHDIGFEHTRTIAAISNTSERKIREALEIQKRPDCLNNREDSKNLNVMWKMLLEPAPTPATHNRKSRDPITSSGGRSDSITNHKYNTRQQSYNRQNQTEKASPNH